MAGPLRLLAIRESPEGQPSLTFALGRMKTPVMLAHGFYVIDELLGFLLGFVGICLLAFFVLRGPPRQSLVLSVLALVVGAPLLYVAYLVSFRMEANYEHFFMLWLGGVACSPFVVGCIGVWLWFHRSKQ
jgi:hypothetical protein